MPEGDTAMQVFAACVEQNVRDAAFTTDALLAYERRLVRELAEAVVHLRGAIEVSAEVVSTPVLDRVYNLTYGAERAARRALKEDDGTHVD